MEGEGRGEGVRSSGVVITNNLRLDLLFRPSYHGQEISALTLYENCACVCTYVCVCVPRFVSPFLQGVNNLPPPPYLNIRKTAPPSYPACTHLLTENHTCLRFVRVCVCVRVSH